MGLYLRRTVVEYVSIAFLAAVMNHGTARWQPVAKCPCQRPMTALFKARNHELRPQISLHARQVPNGKGYAGDRRSKKLTLLLQKMHKNRCLAGVMGGINARVRREMGSSTGRSQCSTSTISTLAQPPIGRAGHIPAG